MKQIRLLTLLALLMTAATGAWAQDAKHLITATHDKQTRSLEQPLPYATTIGELYDAVTGKSFSELISTMSDLMPLTGITSNKTDVVSIGDLNGASTPVTFKADGEATIILNFSGYAQGIFVNVVPPLYVTMKSGVKDADKWTVKVGEGQAQALPIGGLKGDGTETVTLQYNGRLKVKGVKATSDAAPAGNIVDLSTLTADYELQNGDVLTGTLGANVKITIADGATVTLDGVTINGVNNYNCEWAGLNCLGDATIVLKDGSENTLKGFYEDYPGIHVLTGKTLIIKGGTEGTGKLTASPFDGGGTDASYGAGIGGVFMIPCGDISIEGGVITATGGFQAAGIGSGYNATCGNITITGGDITATGGEYAAGIGSGYYASCGNITITGGDITATGGSDAPGIGSGYSGSCGNITIANTVTKVTATKGPDAPNSIGAGNHGTCGTVTIGGNTGAISDSPYTYTPSN